jgi:hypothetical protein
MAHLQQMQALTHMQQGNISGVSRFYGRQWLEKSLLGAEVISGQLTL